MSEKNAVIVTTTFMSSAAYDHRFELARQTCNMAKVLGYPIVVVDGSPDNVTARGALMAAGATLVEQQSEKGMGSSRRQCIKAGLDAVSTASMIETAGFAHALQAFTDISAIAWIEPEKANMVPFLKPCVEMVKQGYDIVVPWRNRLYADLPPYQALSEGRANHEIAEITGLNLDFYVGPRIMSRRAAELLLSYRGKSRVDPAVKYGDNWEILFVPLIWALQDGLRIGSCPVDYVHPAIQTAHEIGNAEMDKKRDFQRATLVAAMRQEAELIGLKRAA